jgi:acyl-CoA-binding protein
VPSRRCWLTSPPSIPIVTKSGQPITKEKLMSLKEQFEAAVAASKNLPERPDNMTLLKIYALFKQASSGDVEGSRPGFTDMVGRAKYDAWAALKGTGSEDAMQQYIDLIESLK